jgi:four helix bundle protein
MDREQLEARTKAFAVAVIALCDSIRSHPSGWTAAKQLSDCSSSVGANYRATSRSRSRAEWVAKMGTVVEEADESVYWLEVALDAHLGDRAAVTRLLIEARELRAIFAASYATSRRNRGKR